MALLAVNEQAQPSLVFTHWHTGTEQVAIALHVIQTFDAWPVLVFAYANGWEHLQLTAVSMLPVADQFRLNV